MNPAMFRLNHVRSGRLAQLAPRKGLYSLVIQLLVEINASKELVSPLEVCFGNHPALVHFCFVPVCLLTTSMHSEGTDTNGTLSIVNECTVSIR